MHAPLAGAWSCPLCAAVPRPFAEVDGRRYARCEACTLISLDPAQRPRPLAEVTRYLEHENSPADERYRAFLDRLGAPLRARLPVGARGLDFGSGPAPVLAAMLGEAGFPTVAYDPFFAPDATLLEHRYDFVACSEVLEHLHAPGETLRTIAHLLAGGGVLGVMTRFYDEAPFEKWWYRRDPTHVCFYAASTMSWISDRFGWRLELPAPHVALFHVPAAR